jgi:hypothetical protein
MLSINGFYVSTTLLFSLTLHFISLPLGVKIYPVLRFVVQLSQFLIQDNGALSLLVVANSSV